MQSKAATVGEYLSSLPDDRRHAISTVRKTILANLDKEYEEGMTYGMIGYYVPRSVYAAGYGPDPSYGRGRRPRSESDLGDVMDFAAAADGD
jgi:hypothetical protein